MSTSSPPIQALFAPKSIEPTPEQLAIQTARDRTIIVEANAGAAKTTTLALRLAESWQRGTEPELCLALTYTPTACAALISALKKLGLPDAVIKRFRVQTFEAFCEEVLDDITGARVPRFDQDEQLRPTIWQAAQRVEDNVRERWRSELHLPSLGDSGMVEDFLRLNGSLKGSLQDTLSRDDQPVSPEYASSLGVDYTQLKMWLAFERIRRRENADLPLFRGPTDATYDLALLLNAGETLAGARAWPSAARVLVVDEMHDLNRATFTVLAALLNTTPCFFCGVGDVDQVIHEAAGADATFMREAIEEFTRRQVRRLPLTHSYRFGPDLATKAGRLAQKPYSSKATHATKVTITDYTDEADCTSRVVAAAQAWQQQLKKKPGEFAVLLRSPYQSVPIENALLAAGLTYVTQGLDSYLTRPEVLFVRGLLAVATDSLGTVAHALTRERVMQALLFFSGSQIVVAARAGETQAVLLAEAVRSVRDSPEFLRHFFDNQVLRNAEPTMKRRIEAAVAIAREQTTQQCLPALLDALKIEAIVREIYVSKQRRLDALGNIQGMLRASAGYASASAYFQSLNDAEERQTKLAKPRTMLSSVKRLEFEPVVLASVAHVKGLEFEHVVMPFLAEGEFPAPWAAPREERNLFYVGITRARSTLTLLHRAAAPSSLMGML